MNKQELAKQYADKKVVKKGQYIEYDFDVRKELTTFDGYDIEQAYEDGYDKAVELACGFLHKVACGYAIRELLTGEPYESKITEDFKKYMEGKDDGTQTKFMGSYTTITETDNGKKYKDYRKDK